MSECDNHVMCYEDLTAYATMLTFGKSRLGTGRSNCRINYLGMSVSSDGLGIAVSAVYGILTGKLLFTVGGTVGVFRGFPLGKLMGVRAAEDLFNLVAGREKKCQYGEKRSECQKFKRFTYTQCQACFSTISIFRAKLKFST